MSAKLKTPARSEKAHSEQAFSKRRDEILRVASQVFAKRGYRNTDVQEIADLLGIGKGTIYRTFASKEELFLACVDDGMQRLSDRMRDYSMQCEQSGLDLLARFERCILEFLSFFDKNDDLVELLMQERSEFRDRPTHSYHRHQVQNRERFHNNMAKAIEEGLLRPLPVDGIIEIINDTLYGAIFTNYFSKKKMHLSSTAKLIADVLIHGICADSHRQQSTLSADRGSSCAPASDSGTTELCSGSGSGSGSDSDRTV